MAQDNIDPEKLPDFTIPESFLDSLEEFTNGGFILFSITEKRKIAVHHRAEDEIASLALHRVVEGYAEDREAVSVETVLPEEGEDDCS